MALYRHPIVWLTPPFGILFMLVLLAIFIFELYMLVHVIRNRFISTNRKLLWIVGMFLLHPFVAIIYYFTDYKMAK